MRCRLIRDPSANDSLADHRFHRGRSIIAVCRFPCQFECETNCGANNQRVKLRETRDVRQPHFLCLVHLFCGLSFLWHLPLIYESFKGPENTTQCKENLKLYVRKMSHANLYTGTLLSGHSNKLCSHGCQRSKQIA